MSFNDKPIALCYLYRQRLPAAAPQALQILSTAHALARAGAWVHLLVDPPLRTASARLGIESLTPDAVLQAYGLSAHPRLTLQWIGTVGGRGGVTYRLAVMRWLVQSRRKGQVPVLYSRRVDYAAEAWIQALVRTGQVLLVHEWHYLASVNALEAGRAHQAERFRRLESEVLQTAHAHCVVFSGIIPWLTGKTPPGLETPMPLPAPTTQPIWLVPNGGPEVTADTAEAVNSNADRVVYAGLFRRPEDLTPLIDAVKQLPPRIQVDVFGVDEERHRFEAVQSAIRSSGLESRIILQGGLAPVALRKMLPAYSIALALFSDSLNMQYFACPLKILEYQALGLPVIASNFPTVRALVSPSETGVLVPPGDANALAQAILGLLADPALRSHLRIAERRQAERQSWLVRGERLFAHLRALADAAD